MRTLSISYATWKAVVQNNGFVPYHRVGGADSVTAWAGAKDLVYRSNVNAEDHADWLVAFPSSVVVPSSDEALANIIGLNNSFLAPHSSDGRPILLSARFRGGVDPYFAGAGDDPTALPGADGRGEGTEFCLGWDAAPVTAADKTLEYQFNDWVYISGGRIRWTGGNAGDTATFKMYAPATVVVVNTGVGNCNLVDLGGYNLIVPATGNGSHDTSGTLIPVPAYDVNGIPNGYWNWDEPDEGYGSVVAASPAGIGNSNLFDIPIDLVKWIVKLQLIGDGNEPISPETNARKVYPQWKFRIDLHNAGPSVLHVSWTMDLARKKTT